MTINNLGNALQDADLLDEALEVRREVLRRRPGDADAHANTHVDADAHADANAHTDTHANAHTDTHADANINGLYSEFRL